MHTHFRKFGKDRKVKKKKKLIYKILPKNNPVTVFCYISFPSFYLHRDIFIHSQTLIEYLFCFKKKSSCC